MKKGLVLLFGIFLFVGSHLVAGLQKKLTIQLQPSGHKFKIESIDLIPGPYRGLQTALEVPKDIPGAPNLAPIGRASTEQDRLFLKDAADYRFEYMLVLIGSADQVAMGHKQRQITVKITVPLEHRPFPKAVDEQQRRLWEAAYAHSVYQGLTGEDTILFVSDRLPHNHVVRLSNGSFVIVDSEKLPHPPKDSIVSTWQPETDLNIHKMGVQHGQGLMPENLSIFVQPGYFNIAQIHKNEDSPLPQMGFQADYLQKIFNASPGSEEYQRYSWERVKMFLLSFLLKNASPPQDPNNSAPYIEQSKRVSVAFDGLKGSPPSSRTSEHPSKTGFMSTSAGARFADLTHRLEEEHNPPPELDMPRVEGPEAPEERVPAASATAESEGPRDESWQGGHRPPVSESSSVVGSAEGAGLDTGSGLVFSTESSSSQEPKRTSDLKPPIGKTGGANSCSKAGESSLGH